MSVETNDGYGNGEIIEHKKVIDPNVCPKCKTTNMTPRFFAVGASVPWKRQMIDDIKRFMRNDDYYYSDQVEIEHIVWTCTACQYQVAKDIS